MQLCLLLGVMHLSAAAKPAAPIDKVRRLRQTLQTVVQMKGLSAPLVKEAQSVEADADQALDHHASGTALLKVLGEYKQFLGDLAHRQEDLKSEGGAAEADKAAHLSQMVSTMEAKVKKLLSHLKSDSKGLSKEQASRRELLMQKCQHALEMSATTMAAMTNRALALHDALREAHDYMAQRVKEIDSEQKKLGDEIEETEVMMLYKMLQQRQKLPMRSQLAILKRHQFAKCSYAKQLLKNHKEKGPPLFKQLEDMLPQNLAQKTAPKAGNATFGHLAVAGSEGRVRIVSSEMKNTVKKMMIQLAGARSKLQLMLKGNSLSADEQKQAQKIVSEIDSVNSRAEKTHDLKTQLDLMDAMEQKMVSWTASMIAGEKKTQVAHASKL